MSREFLLLVALSGDFGKFAFREFPGRPDDILLFIGQFEIHGFLLNLEFALPHILGVKNVVNPVAGGPNRIPTILISPMLEKGHQSPFSKKVPLNRRVATGWAQKPL
jgi:hypothetical protein